MIRITFPSLSLAMLCLCSFTGCGSSTESVESPAATPEATAASVVEDKAPSDADKEAMLAARDDLFQQLSGRLMEVMGSKGPAAAISVCKDEATTIAKQVGQKHGLRIGRTGVRLRNPNNQAPEWAKSYTAEKADTPRFVSLTSGDAAALLPIKLKAQCLMCHGPKEQIAPVIQDQLTRLYPSDDATGFKEGELRGWFWIEKPAS